MLRAEHVGLAVRGLRGESPGFGGIRLGRVGQGTSLFRVTWEVSVSIRL